jgi:chemotaxis family two-component system sensor kinase Cph1
MTHSKTVITIINSTIPVNPNVAICGQACVKPAINTPIKTGLGTQIIDFFSRLFDTSDWPPRWYCGNWSDFHGWLYICSDLLIWASYFAIPVLLIRMLRGRSDIPFAKMIWLFIAFIILCGTTHLLDAIIFWWPAYRLSALVRLCTGIVSAMAVYAYYKVMPLILSLRTVQDLEREINERKIVEERLYHSHQQLKTFTYILSHNIRNHSSNISLLTNLFDPTTLDENNAELFDKLGKVSVGLNKTLDDLGEAIKIRESKIESEVLYFREVTASVMEIVGLELSAHKVEVKLDFKVETVLFPKLYLESVLINLLSNAIKYRKKTVIPKITLRTYIDVNNHTVLECQDNGVGIDMKLYGDKIFGLYKTFHEHKEGHGVGLFLVKTQVESQGGVIAVDSEPGVGSTFKILFDYL